MRKLRYVTLAVLVAATVATVAPVRRPATPTPIAELQGGSWLTKVACALCVGGLVGLVLSGPQGILFTLLSEDELMTECVAACLIDAAAG